jgi:hypothetical protein
LPLKPQFLFCLDTKKESKKVFHDYFYARHYSSKLDTALTHAINKINSEDFDKNQLPYERQSKTDMADFDPPLLRFEV